jgi:hypothetical protein
MKAPASQDFSDRSSSVIEYLPSAGILYEVPRPVNVLKGQAPGRDA